MVRYAAVVRGEWGHESGRPTAVVAWSILGDAIFIGLGASTDDPVRADADLDERIVEVDGGYRVAKRVDLLFGARYVSLDSKIAFGGPLMTTVSDSESWVDPAVGGRFLVPIGKKGEFVPRVDVGGFGVGADFAWQAMAHFIYRSSEHAWLVFGYRAMDEDYEQGSGADLFQYNIRAAGPDLGLVIHW